MSAVLRAAALPRHALRLQDTDVALCETAAAILREVVPAHELTTTVRDLVARVNATKSDAPAHRALADAKAECDLWQKVRDDAVSYAAARAGA